MTDDTQPASTNGGSRPAGRPKGSANKRPPMKVSDLTIEINTLGFEKVRDKYGRSFTPKIACRVIDYMKKILGDEAVVPESLSEFAAKKRPGRAISGPMTAPKTGESRPYQVSEQGRIGISVETIRGEPGKQVFSTFNEMAIVVTKEKPGEGVFVVPVDGGILITSENPDDA